MTTIETITETSPDISITKTELFDVDFARWIVENKAIPKDDRAMVSRYLKNRVRGNEHETTYKLGKHCKGQFLGRFCAVRSESLQCFPRDIRNALAMKQYWDVDMVNAQPTLLVQYCEKNGWVCDAVKKYVEQREEMLSVICDMCNVERWEAKDRVISILFGSGVDADMPDFFRKEFYSEIRCMMKNNWGSQFKWLEKQPNPYAKALAYTLQTEERKCLLAMDRSFTRHKRSLDVLIHDGGLVRKKAGELALPETLLREVETDVFNETGYKISLLVKPMTTSFEMESDGTDEEYKQLKEEFEKTHFKLMNPYCIIRIYNKEIVQYSESDFRAVYRNKLCGDVEFTTLWLKDPGIRTYEKLAFDIDEQNVEKDCFNIFKGWNYDAFQGDISAVQQVLRLVCNNDETMMQYVEKWLASILQHKIQKTTKCIVVQGEQGVGKDTYFDFVGSIFGDYFYNTGNPEVDVFGPFNSHLIRTVFLKFEEASFLTNKTNDSKLKNMLSAPYMPFHPKGQKPFTLKSFVNCVMTTNQFIPVVLEDTDRRFVLIQASSEKRGDVAFWTNIHTTLAKKETKEAYLYHLLHLDLTGFVVTDTTALRTDYHKDVILAERPYHARFLQDRIAEDFPLVFKSRDLWKMMKENCRFDISETSFGRAMKIYEDVSMTKHRKTDGVYYEFDCEKLKEQLKQKNWWNNEFE